MQNGNIEFLCVRRRQYLEVLKQKKTSQIILNESSENMQEEKRMAGERQYEFGIPTTRAKISSKGEDKGAYMKKNLQYTYHSCFSNYDIFPMLSSL